MNTRHLHLIGATGKPRRASLHGREHLVVPVVALMEGVIHAVNADQPEFVPSGVLARAAHTWNGRPLLLGHAVENGAQVSGNTPKVLERQAFGTIFESTAKGTRLGMEAWVDPERLKSLGQERMLADLEAGKPIEVSVGAFVQTAAKAGEWNGKPYGAEWSEAYGDHLAFLPGGRGACSIEMGCGAHRAAQAYAVDNDGLRALYDEDQPRDEYGKWSGGGGGGGMVNRVLLFFRSLMPRGWGDDEVKQELRDALHALEPMARNGDIVRVTNDQVVYCVYPPANYALTDAPMPIQYWRRSYTFADGTFTLGDREAVEPTTVYVPRAAEGGAELRAAGATKECSHCGGTGSYKGNPCDACDGTGELKAASENTDCKCGGHRSAEETDMNKQERIAALMAHSHNPLKDQKALEAMDDKALESLEKNCDDMQKKSKKDEDDLKAAQGAATEAAGKLKAAEAKTMTTEEFMQAAPADLRALIDRQKAADTARRAELVTALKAAQDAYTEQELQAMPLENLERVAKVAKIAEPAPVADYSGRGVPRVTGAAAGDFAPPDSYAAGRKQAQSVN